MTVTNFPNATPNFFIGFQGSRKLDPRITFTRATGSNEASGVVGGQVRYFPLNVPRLTDRGLTIEGSRTNIQLTSANPITAGGQNLTWVTGLDAPDGSTDAVRIVATATDTVHNITATIFPAAMPLVDHAWSCFARAEGVNRFTLRNPENGFCTFDLRDEGTVINPNAEPATITPVGGGWFRCTVTGAPGTVAYQYNITLNADDETGFVPFLGDGTSGIRFWGWQMERGTFSSSYIPTTTAEVTRSADICDIRAADFDTFYNVNESTVVTASQVDWTWANAGANNQRIFHSSEQNGDPAQIQILYNATNDEIGGTSSPGIQASSDLTDAEVQRTVKAAMSIDTQNTTSFFSSNGVNPQNSSARANVVNPDFIRLGGLTQGNDAIGRDQLFGYIQGVTIYPNALTQDNLNSLTTVQT